MNKLYMGLDIGSETAGGVLIDEYNNIIASSYIYINDSVINTTKKLIKELKSKIDINKYVVVSIGVTGAGRRLIGILLNANIIKNEITALATGTLSIYKNTKTIFEIGAHDSKIIILNNGTVVDFTINTPCTSIRGSFLNSLSQRLNIDIKDINNINSTKNIINIPPRCTIFAESIVLDKISEGYSKEDIISSVCKSIAINYINNVTKNKIIKGSIIFTGGLSKNKTILKTLEELTNEKIIVDTNSHLMASIGIAILARNTKKEQVFNFDIDELTLETKIHECNNCQNNCSIVEIYRNNKLIDYWGNNCDKVLSHN